MKQEDKELLLKDLCTRMPYGVKAHIINEVNIEKDVVLSLGNLPYIQMINIGLIKECKPYLFPLSSMTEEQKKEYAHILVMSSNLACSQLIGETTQDWFNKNHFDYRGLIPMGLAIDATGLNVY